MKNILVKLGGSVITDTNYRQSIIKQLVEIKSHGYNVCIVHGGGKLISHYLNKFEIKSEFYEGLRITSQESLDVVMMVLVGKVNKDIVKGFNFFNVPAIGLCGGDGKLIEATKLILNESVDLGQVGVPSGVNVKLYNSLVEMGYVVVIATIGFGLDGYYNINADHTASFVAQAINADHLIYVSDVDGVLHPETKELFGELDKQKINKLRETNIITEGMLPKLSSCLLAIENGVSNVTILNGKKINSIIDAVINKRLIGTRIV